ncbi:MAG: DUF4157 domain-containing protein [Humibacillus sp.]|nr:DUF4157 domain-containing protein [Humibacillus sp.]
MTDQDEASVPLGRRLDALARARVAALVPRPAWAAPLTVALRHIEEVADVLGERFERAETRPGKEPTIRVDLPAAAAAVPGAWAGHGRPAARGRPPPHDPRTLAGGGEPRGPGGGRGAEATDDDLRKIPADVRSRLRREVGQAADVMRVHAGPHADAHARAEDADAVTLGRDVYLRQGRWAPRREEGVALLAHEATHVAGLVDPGGAWRRAVGGAAEESLARARERSLLPRGGAPAPTDPGGGTGWPATLEGPGTRFGSSSGHDGLGSAAVASNSDAARPTPAAAPAGPSPPAVAVRGSGRRASVERDLTPAAAPDLDALRRGVIAEVMQRLRSEIERGA